MPLNVDVLVFVPNARLWSGMQDYRIKVVSGDVRASNTKSGVQKTCSKRGHKKDNSQVRQSDPGYFKKQRLRLGNKKKKVGAKNKPYSSLGMFLDVITTHSTANCCR